MSRTLQLMVALASWATVAQAWAPAAGATHTYVVTIGNNLGLPDQAQLRYAERDATEVSTVMQRLANVDPQDSVVALGQTADQVRATLLELNARIRAAGSDAVLMVYYSGHADARGLHLGGTTLPYTELKAIVSGSAARMRVLILDACRSGGATRVKGVTAAKPFAITLENQVKATGVAIVTSSAATEDSHESERLRGSFFSHHLVNGLRGAADRNGDGLVTLDEVYSYTYHQTLRSSGQTTQLQHPTYQYKLKGKGELVLTRLSHDRRRSAELVLPGSGVYLAMQGSETGPVAAEVVASRADTRVVLPPGRYFVQHRRRASYVEYEVQLEAGQSVSLATKRSRTVAYARLLRKGGGEATAVHGLQLLGGARGEILPGQGVSPQVTLAYGIDLAWMTFGLRARWSMSSIAPAAGAIETDHMEVGLALTAQRFIDLSWLSVSLGVLVEGSWMRQSFTTSGQASDRSSWSVAFGALLGLERELVGGLSLRLEGGPLAHVLERQVTRGGGPAGSETETPLTWWAAGGLVWRF